MLIHNTVGDMNGSNVLTVIIMKFVPVLESGWNKDPFYKIIHKSDRLIKLCGLSVLTWHIYFRGYTSRCNGELLITVQFAWEETKKRTKGIHIWWISCNVDTK